MEVDDGDDGASAVSMPLCEDWQMFDADDDLESGFVPSDTWDNLHIPEPETGSLSLDQLRELQSKDVTGKIPPELKEWKSIHPTDDTPQVTVALARRRMWEAAKQEIKLHQANVKNLPPNGATTMCGKVHNCFFGVESKLFELFHASLGLSKESHCLFLYTFFKSCPMRTSVKTMNRSDDMLGIMETEAYNNIWREINNLPKKGWASHSGSKSKEFLM